MLKRLRQNFKPQHEPSKTLERSESLEKITTWLKTKFGQEDRVKTLNQSQDGIQEDKERETPTFYTADDEEVKTEPQPLYQPSKALERNENLETRTNHLCKTSQGAR